MPMRDDEVGKHYLHVLAELNKYGFQFASSVSGLS